MLTVSVENKIPELFQKLERAAGRFVRSAAEEIGSTAKAAMGGSRSGRFYGSHRASAPGEAPAGRSGRYLSGIAVISQNSLEAKVGAAAPYAPILEYGLDRPLWEKTLAEIVPTLEARLENEIAGI